MVFIILLHAFLSHILRLAMAKKSRYLVQRNSGFYARIVMPVALQPMLGKKQI